MNQLTAPATDENIPFPGADQQLSDAKISVEEIAKAEAEEAARVAEQARIKAEAARIKAEEITKAEIVSIEAQTMVRADLSPLNFSVPSKRDTLQYIQVNSSRFVDRFKSMNYLLLLTVVLPTLISSIYFGLIASDVYISESRFVVRSPQHQVNTGLGALFQGAGFSRSQDDTYTVHDYIFSRDALKKLDDQFAVGKAFASSGVDIFSRFSGLDWDNSFEALHRYYQKHVSLDLDTSSSILTLSVSAFTPVDAYQLNEKLLEMSESLVNQLNERGRQDMIRFVLRIQPVDATDWPNLSAGVS